VNYRPTCLISTDQLRFVGLVILLLCRMATNFVSILLFYSPSITVLTIIVQPSFDVRRLTRLQPISTSASSLTAYNASLTRHPLDLSLRPQHQVTAAQRRRDLLVAASVYRPTPSEVWGVAAPTTVVQYHLNSMFFFRKRAK